MCIVEDSEEANEVSLNVCENRIEFNLISYTDEKENVVLG